MAINTSERPQIKDLMYELLQEPSKEKFREFLLGNTGEQDNIDYKLNWIDKGSLSKLILALGNSGGGIIVIGVNENDDGSYDPIGINELIDKSTISDMIKKYVPTSLEYSVLDFVFKTSEYEKLIGKKFQLISINDTPEHLPFVSLGETNGIENNTIYVRRGTKCEKANSIEIERILNKRINTQYSSSSTLNLDEHLKQLRVLYYQIEPNKKNIINSPFLDNLANAFQGLSLVEYESYPNPNYPEEDFEGFILRMIKNKKMKVEKILDLK